MMFERTILHSQLKERLRTYDNAYNTTQSSNWIQALVDTTETLNKQSPDTHDIHCEFSKLPKPTDRIRWQLSRIPKRLRYDEREVLNLRGDMTIERGVWWKQIFHKVGSDTCPEDVLEQQTYTKGTYIWCFYQPTLAKEMGFEIIPTWDTEDSIVNWVTQFIQQPTLYSAKIATIENDIHCIIRDERTANQNILDFINQNPPIVTTKQILQQNFAGKRVTYKILRRLQRQDNIVRIKQGHYAPHHS